MKAGRGLTVKRSVEAGAGESRQLLPLRTGTVRAVPIGIWTCVMQSSESRWNGPATGGGGSRGVAAAGVDGESEAGLPAHARRQSALRAEAEVRGDHRFQPRQKVYPNLARKMVLTGMDQLWRADITYIRLRDEFVFLAVILDAYSRRVIGWALDRTIEDGAHFAGIANGVGATGGRAWTGPPLRPRLAICQRRLTRICSRKMALQISMSRKGNPWDNAACESFMKTLKYEEVHRNEYRDLDEARSCNRRVFLRRSITESGFTPRSATCHRRSSKPTHSTTKGGRCAAAYLMSFSRHREIFRSDAIRSVRERLAAAPGLIVSMSFQLAIPRRVVLQHCPLPLRQPIAHSALQSSCRSSRFSSNGQAVS